MIRKVLILVNHEIVIYNFRKELVVKLLESGYDVYISSPPGSKIDFLINLGAKHIDTKINRHGLNFIEDYKLLRFYSSLMKKIRPLVVLTYTIKPNIYGGFAAKKNKIPYIANITGLGSAFENGGLMKKALVYLYKKAMKEVNIIYFQNLQNMETFISYNIGRSRHKLLPGSGVNLTEFCYVEYPKTEFLHFAFLSRVMKEKGIDLYIETAKHITNKFKNVVFHVCGFCEENYESLLQELSEFGIIKYHGMIQNIPSFLEDIHCVIHPSNYPEGLSNILLEAQSCGRPVITYDRPGCREAIDVNKSGFLMEEWTAESLIEQIERFINLSPIQRSEMGINGRHFVQQFYDRNIVVNEYCSRVNGIL